MMKRLAVTCGAILLGAIGALAQDIVGYGEIGQGDSQLNSL